MNWLYLNPPAAQKVAPDFPPTVVELLGSDPRPPPESHGGRGDRDERAQAYERDGSADLDQDRGAHKSNARRRRAADTLVRAGGGYAGLGIGSLATVAKAGHGTVSGTSSRKRVDYGTELFKWLHSYQRFTTLPIQHILPIQTPKYRESENMYPALQGKDRSYRRPENRGRPCHFNAGNQGILAPQLQRARSQEHPLARMHASQLLVPGGSVRRDTGVLSHCQHT